jgi:ABC-type proline/glycine betaine transport system ATPase subunit
LLVTHNLDEGLAVASHAAVMVDGRIVRVDDASRLDARRYFNDYRALVLAGAASADRRPANALT